MASLEYNKKMIEEFNKGLLSVFDDCLMCGKENKLKNGLCLVCWIKERENKEALR